MVSEQVIGGVVVQSFRKQAFSESDESLLVTLAANMGVIIENARLFEEAEQRNTELEIINSVQQGMASKLELQAIFDLVGDRFQHAK